jgi:hypothetical protein
MSKGSTAKEELAEKTQVVIKHLKSLDFIINKEKSRLTLYVPENRLILRALLLGTAYKAVKYLLI